MQVNSVGIIDQDYMWDDDTIKFAFVNMWKEVVHIRAGDRIGQGLFASILKPEFEFVEKMNQENRGWFGTTGVNENV